MPSWLVSGVAAIPTRAALRSDVIRLHPSKARRPPRYARDMSEPHARSRLLILDLLESYARERDIHVVLERMSDHGKRVCVLREAKSGLSVCCSGDTAREAIRKVLEHQGVEIAK